MNGVFAAYVGEGNGTFEMETILENLNVWLPNLHCISSSACHPLTILKFFVFHSIREKKDNTL